ncbi:uncharacterized protein SEPMUDRAFT_120449 [Sphaerulina musiva SO2202]|uniref:Uncharacterized protein n=1 Tax=Sphaerulina musiva (strain SO2202) TaxID=692275 RepID=N1QDN6_SPHMS|nr:uncharacterized protein SEPMUDRAFT_120449 [Sphaerulina musiva SO2202]EMF09611.1 hypothetical protein SEPMUDRAFT_120449 [Sphaerulina musiva SO2202]
MDMPREQEASQETERASQERDLAAREEQVKVREEQVRVREEQVQVREEQVKVKEEQLNNKEQELYDWEASAYAQEAEEEGDDDDDDDGQEEHDDDDDGQEQQEAEAVEWTEEAEEEEQADPEAKEYQVNFNMCTACFKWDAQSAARALDSDRIPSDSEVFLATPAAVVRIPFDDQYDALNEAHIIAKQVFWYAYQKHWPINCLRRYPESYNQVRFGREELERAGLGTGSFRTGPEKCQMCEETRQCVVGECFSMTHLRNAVSHPSDNFDMDSLIRLLNRARRFAVDLDDAARADQIQQVMERVMQKARAAYRQIEDCVGADYCCPGPQRDPERKCKSSYPVESCSSTTTTTTTTTTETDPDQPPPPEPEPESSPEEQQHQQQPPPTTPKINYSALPYHIQYTLHIIPSYPAYHQNKYSPTILLAAKLWKATGLQPGQTDEHFARVDAALAKIKSNPEECTEREREYYERFKKRSGGTMEKICW